MLGVLERTAAEATLNQRFLSPGQSASMSNPLIDELHKRTLCQSYLFSWADQLPFIDPEIGFRYQ